MVVGISSTKVIAIELSTLVTSGCPPGFGVLLWEGVWFLQDILESLLPLLKWTQHKTSQMEKHYKENNVRHLFSAKIFTQKGLIGCANLFVGVFGKQSRV